MEGFIRFANAYNGEGENDYTTRRFRISSIIMYEAWDWVKYHETTYEKQKKKDDLGETAYCIYFKYTQGSSSSETRIFFWTKKQRDETLIQLDNMLGVQETTIPARITVINPAYDTIPEGSAIIQDLPTLS